MVLTGLHDRNDNDALLANPRIWNENIEEQALGANVNLAMKCAHLSCPTWMISLPVTPTLDMQMAVNVEDPSKFGARRHLRKVLNNEIRGMLLNVNRLNRNLFIFMCCHVIPLSVHFIIRVDNAGFVGALHDHCPDQLPSRTDGVEFSPEGLATFSDSFLPGMSVVVTVVGLSNTINLHQGQLLVEWRAHCRNDDNWNFVPLSSNAIVKVAVVNFFAYV